MKFCLFILFIVSGCSVTKPINDTSLRPNILYINVDDLGWMDSGVYGSDFYETPNIDRLAQMGMIFTKAYAGASNCAPSRACLISGQNTPRHGIFTVANSDRGVASTRKLIPVANNEVLHDSVITIAEMLQQAGYRTGIFGKWHLGENPKTQGFNVNVGGSHRGNPGRKGYFAPYNLHDLKNATDGENLTDRLTDEAIQFMKASNKQPFFTYLPYYAVHTPLQTTATLEKKYRNKTANQYQNNAVYAGMIETVDRNIGLLLAYLKQSGQLEKTLIIFTSDNGGIRDISNQDPLRAGKGSYYEGGIRVPFIFTWKGQIQPNTTNNSPISNLDIYPTLMEYTGSALKNKLLDGISLVPLLKGETIQNRDLFFHFPIYLQAYNPKTDQGRDPLFRTRPGTVVISGNWKLHHYFENDEFELYDLNSDLGEQHNLINSHKEEKERLLQKMDAWRSNTNAPVPTVLNPQYQKPQE